MKQNDQQSTYDKEAQLRFKRAWKQLRYGFKEQLGRLPDLQSILFIIGIQELGFFPDSLSKEEKQDLMHIAVCRLLSEIGYFSFTGRDEDGWPHYEAVKNIPVDFKNLEKEEQLLKEQALRYFEIDW